MTILETPRSCAGGDGSDLIFAGLGGFGLFASAGHLSVREGRGVDDYNGKVRRFGGDNKTGGKQSDNYATMVYAV